MFSKSIHSIVPTQVSKIKLKTHRRKRLRLETLESRRLLAGDVTVKVVDGDLFLVGDRLANAVEITQRPDAGAGYLIRGLPNADGEVTTVNGLERIVVEGVTGDLNAAMKAGDDLIYIHDADLPGDVVIRTDGGNDTVLMGGLPRAGDPLPAPLPADLIDAALTGAATTDGLIDPVPISPRANVTIAGSALIHTANGKDGIAIGSVDVRGNMAIHTGRHADRLTLGLNELPGPIDDAAIRIVDFAPGINLPLNVFGSFGLDTGAGDDAAWLESVHVANRMRVDLGIGNDVLSYDWGAVSGNLTIGGGGGDDLIGLAHLKAESILVATGRGDDGVGLRSVVANRLAVNLGVGNDQMRVTDSSARFAQFHGGLGEDSIEFKGENQLQQLLVFNFEVIS